MSSRILIIGCGYVGLPLALRLIEQGHEVSGWVHSTASAATLREHHFERIVIGSVANEEVWAGVAEKYDVVIHGASSGRGGPEAYREVFLEGVARMKVHQAQARKILISSTSVYGQTLGEIVTEESPAEPITETGRILREAEKAALDAEAMVIRSSGIYGPGRAVLWEKFRRGEAVIEGDGQQWINQIHRDDLVAALLHLVDKGAPGEIYNASDGAPVTQLDFYEWCAEFLQKPLPPYGPINTQRKRGLTNKRVANAKLRATGWMPGYSSFREGLAGGFFTD
jgi:nucleoside-diphosphate-sugar epimerase